MSRKIGSRQRALQQIKETRAARQEAKKQRKIARASGKTDERLEAAAFFENQAGAFFPNVPKETTPSEITPKISELCEQLAPGQVPVLIPVVAEPGAKYGDCLDNLPPIVRDRGGIIRTGWCIWEINGVILNAERHAVWRTNGGELIDVTPKPGKEQTVLFLPDNTQWDGTKTPGTIVPLADDIPILKYARAAQRMQNDMASNVDSTKAQIEGGQALLELSAWLGEKRK